MLVWCKWAIHTSLCSCVTYLHKLSVSSPQILQIYSGIFAGLLLRLVNKSQYTLLQSYLMVILSAIAPAVASSGDANGKICRSSKFCKKTEFCTQIFWCYLYSQVIGETQQEDLLCTMKYAVYVCASNLFNLTARQSKIHPAFTHTTRSVTRRWCCRARNKEWGCRKEQVGGLFCWTTEGVGGGKNRK